MTGYRWAWSRFRILRIVFFLLLIIGFSPLVPVGFAQYAVLIEIFWAITLLALGLYLWKWKCPRCHKPFVGKTKKWLLLPHYCPNCGLPKYSLGPAHAPDRANRSAS
jgi:hypothetical protein